MKKAAFYIFSGLSIGTAQHTSSVSASYEGNAEVWFADQSDTSEAGGGVLYVTDLTGDIKTTMDFNDLTAQAGCSQNKRPHMLTPYPGEASVPTNLMVFSSVASGNVQVVDASTKAIVGCIDFPLKADGSPASLHHSVMADDGSYFLGLDIGGRLFKVDIEQSADGAVQLDIAATLTLTEEMVPTIAPAKPICGVRHPQNGFYYITLGGGGLLVVAVRPKAIQIKHVYSKDEVPGVGCSVDHLPDGSMVTGGASHTGANTIFHWPAPKGPKDFPAPIQVAMEEGSDIHSTFSCVAGDETYLWVSKRLTSGMSVIDLKTHQVVAENAFPLPQEGGAAPFPDVGTFLASSEGGGRAFVALRGAEPLTAISSFQDESREAGWVVFDIDADCKGWSGLKYVKATNPTVKPADIHGVSLVYLPGARPPLQSLATFKPAQASGEAGEVAEAADVEATRPPQSQWPLVRPFWSPRSSLGYTYMYGFGFGQPFNAYSSFPSGSYGISARPQGLSPYRLAVGRGNFFGR